MAYAGSARDDIIELLLPLLSDEKASMQCIGMAAVSLGLIAISTCNSHVTESILHAMMDKTEKELKDPFAKFLALGLGLTYLGKIDEK